jgi:hypothetical protein
MSDQSIASIARSLAAALISVCRPPSRKTEQQCIIETGKIVDLEMELCAEYRAEIIAVLKVSA